ncbi:MAG: hypothetical protein OXG06_01715 [Gammaproteobacteria bacterium]|nr:hypothetical protein [Gammaproteobacteria bacterium]
MLESLLEFKFIFVALAWGSLTLFVVSLAVIPWLVTKIPADYFRAEYRRSKTSGGKSVPIQLLLGLKNLFGFLLILLGLVMLVLPGQGILTIVIGLFLMNFPGKYKLERALVSKPKVLNSLNWIRAKAQKPPLVIAP